MAISMATHAAAQPAGHGHGCPGSFSDRPFSATVRDRLFRFYCRFVLWKKIPANHAPRPKVNGQHHAQRQPTGEAEPWKRDQQQPVKGSQTISQPGAITRAESCFCGHALRRPKNQAGHEPGKPRQVEPWEMKPPPEAPRSESRGESEMHWMGRTFSRQPDCANNF